MQALLFLLSFILVFLDVFAAPNQSCSKAQFIDYLTGYGESRSFSEARADAFTDLASFFGVNISKNETLLESNGTRNPRIRARTNISIDEHLKGAEVLRRCQLDNTVAVLVGVRKSILKVWLEERMKERKNKLDQLAKTLSVTANFQPFQKEKSQFSKIMNEEHFDQEKWNLLKFESNQFQTLPSNSVNSIQQRIIYLEKKLKGISFSLVPKDSFSSKTLEAIRNHLIQDGYKIMPGTTRSLIWQCLLNKRLAVGRNVSFKCTCRIESPIIQIPELSVEGITPQNNVENEALRLIQQTLNSSPAAN